MAADAHAAADFYGTSRGTVTARLVSERLTAMWPDLRGESVLGIGFTAPYLRLWHDQATRCIALTPAQMGDAMAGGRTQPVLHSGGGCVAVP